MAVFQILLLIVSITNDVDGGLESEQKLDRVCIHHHEERARQNINTLEFTARPCRALATDPIDDPQRVAALVMMAQRRISRHLRIPEELQRLIHEYSDHNEIRALFRMLPSTRDRMEAFGFESYEAMHLRYPTKKDKVNYFNEVKAQILKGMKERPQIVVSLVFDREDNFIQNIWMGQQRSHFNNPVKLDFNWDAVAELAFLEVVCVNGLNINLSMEDIQKLPASVKQLQINDNHWTTANGDVDLDLLPRQVKVFSANGCQGMTGALKLHAPCSNLVALRVRDTDLYLHIGRNTQLPRFLGMIVDLPRNANASTILMLQEKLERQEM